MKQKRQAEQFEFLITRMFSYIAVFLIPFYFIRFEIASIPTNIFEVAVLVAILPMLFELVIHKRKPHAGHIWPYLILFIAGFSIFFANDTREALGIFKGWFLAPAVLYLLIVILLLNLVFP